MASTWARYGQSKLVRHFWLALARAPRSLTTSLSQANILFAVALQDRLKDENIRVRICLAAFRRLLASLTRCVDTGQRPSPGRDQHVAHAWPGRKLRHLWGTCPCLVRLSTCFRADRRVASRTENRQRDAAVLPHVARGRRQDADLPRRLARGRREGLPVRAGFRSFVLDGRTGLH